MLVLARSATPTHGIGLIKLSWSPESIAWPARCPAGVQMSGCLQIQCPCTVRPEKALPEKLESSSRVLAVVVAVDSPGQCSDPGGSRNSSRTFFGDPELWWSPESIEWLAVPVAEGQWPLHDLHDVQQVSICPVTYKSSIRVQWCQRKLFQKK